MLTMSPMSRLAAVAALGGTLLLGGCASSSKSMSALPSSALSAAGPAIEAITKAVPGLSQAQAILGAGSMLGLAKAKMPADQFSQVAGAIPGSDALIADATSKGLPSNVGSLADVTSFLGKSGISADQVKQLVPAISGLVKGKVPDDVTNALVAALGG